MRTWNKESVVGVDGSTLYNFSESRKTRSASNFPAVCLSQGKNIFTHKIYNIYNLFVFFAWFS